MAQENTLTVVKSEPLPSLSVSKSEPMSTTQSDSGALAMRGAAAALPVVASGLKAVVASPTLAKTTGAMARGGTTAAGILHGVVTMNPAEVIAAPRAGWAAGRGGYWLGKIGQQLMAPAAKVAEALAPYAQALSTLSGAQGVLDLAQMAEPNRKDIGVLGMSMSGGRTDAEKQANPALLNQLFQSLEEKWHGFMGSYPKEVGKSSWNALNPTQRLEAFHTFMQKETGGG